MLRQTIALLARRASVARRWHATPRGQPSVATTSRALSVKAAGGGESNATITREMVDDGGMQPTILGVKLDQELFSPMLLDALSMDNASALERRRVRKQLIVERFRRSESDTGSPEVQIALMTDKIRDLTAHMIKHRKDKMKKRSMAMAVGQRRRMMQYLLHTDSTRYLTLCRRLGLRPNSVFPKRLLGAKKDAVRVLTIPDDIEPDQKVQ